MLKLNVLRGMILGAFLFAVPIAAFANSSSAQSTPAPSDKITAMENRLKAIEETQGKIVENQEKILEEIHSLRILVRRS